VAQEGLLSTNVDVRIKSVSQFTEIVCQYRDQWIEGAAYSDPWFRGHQCASWLLEPNIFRYELLNEEDDIREEFERRAPQYMTEPPPANMWGWYFLMQHYGAPTRLLDWTDSALVALFFALNSPVKAPVKKKEKVEDSAVWMLDPWWLNKTILNDDVVLSPNHKLAGAYLTEANGQLDENRNTRIIPRDPAAIDPPFIARRVAVQKSRFTIFGHARDGLIRLRDNPNSRIVKITVAREKADRMRADLLTLGMSDTGVYPDLHGLSEELIRYHLGNWPPD
jgi:FRG domain